MSFFLIDENIKKKKKKLFGRNIFKNKISVVIVWQTAA